MFLAKLRLRRAAMQLVAQSWPVMPGAWLRAGRFDCGRPGCPTTTCHPAMDGWEQAASHDRNRVEDWWRYAPHSLLLATGIAFDVLEVSAPLGALVVGSPHWRGPVRGPVATTPTGRWMFLIAPSPVLLPELAGRLDVLRHSRGSWIPAPPTRLVEGAVRWTVPPAEVRWRLPDGYEVQRLVADVLPTIVPRARKARSSPLGRAA